MFNALTVPVEKIGVPLWLLIGLFAGVLVLVYVYLRKKAVYVVYIKDEYVPDVITQGDPLYPRLRKHSKRKGGRSVQAEEVSECLYKKMSRGVYIKVKDEE